MLQLEIPDREYFDESTSTFIQIKGQTILLEHSLISLSKWEAKWKKPFLSNEEKTYEETLDYVRCMTVTKNVDPNLYFGLSRANIEAVNSYIEDPMTATTFSNRKQGRSREIVTSELIYYWMIALQIPSEYEKWHLNRLLTLIRVCNIKNEPPKKMGKGEILRRNRALNAARRAKAHSSG